MTQLTIDERQSALGAYERDGYTVFRNVIDAELIEEAQAHVAWLGKRYPNLRPEHYHHPLVRDDAFWVRLIADSRLLDIAELFVGPDISCFTSHYVCKPPLDGHAVLWHQDGAYWDLRPMRAVTLWLAIDHSGPDNGCVRMLPGTHREAILPLEARLEKPNMLASSLDFERFKDITPIDVVLNPGDVSVHHPHIVHGSEPNRSAHRRCGLDIGYMPASVGIHNEALYQTPILVRGDAPRDRQYQPWPEVRLGETIHFRGDAQWNRTAAEKNARFQHLQNSEDDPLTVTSRMMERLNSGTVKTGAKV